MVYWAKQAVTRFSPTRFFRRDLIHRLDSVLPARQINAIRYRELKPDKKATSNEVACVSNLLIG
jgi:hypothetical protein